MHREVTGYEQWMLDAFRGPDEHPMKKAIMALLDEAAQADLNLVTTPEACNSERHFCAGRLSAIQDLHSEFAGLFKEANRLPDEPAA
jgi:hypothetical protein